MRKTVGTMYDALRRGVVQRPRISGMGRRGDSKRRTARQGASEAAAGKYDGRVER